MAKEISYTQSEELRLLAEELRLRYLEVIGYVELDKVWFAFLEGDEFFAYDTIGLKTDWVKFATEQEPKLYCIAFNYDVYQYVYGSKLEWLLLECLYAINPKMNGKLRFKNIREFSCIIDTLMALDFSFDWRESENLPRLLGEESVVFSVNYGDDE